MIRLSPVLQMGQPITRPGSRLEGCGIELIFDDGRHRLAGSQRKALFMSAPTVPPELSVHDLNARLAKGDAITLIDVRETNEVALCGIPGAIHIPLAEIPLRLGEIPLRLGEIPADKPIVMYCHHGRRSQQAGQFLTAKGIANVYNVTGGIHAWATEIDPDMARY